MDRCGILRFIVVVYFSIDKMLKNMKEAGSSNLKFWASNIHYMNDPHELEFIYDELINLAPVIGC